MVNIFISAGESSGDLLGADLARALHHSNHQLLLTGMGGKKMRDAGVDIQFPSEKLSVVGIFEVITRLPIILCTLRAIKKYFIRTKPDLIILIDFPDTHFRLLKTAKKLNIPVLYYVSPQIWAWRFHRIKQIKKYVAHMAVLFSFEEKIYRDAHIPVTMVGHPLSQLTKPSLSKNAAYDFFKLNPNQPIVTLLPGSRDSELENHLPVLLESAYKILEKKPDAQFAFMLASHFDLEKIRKTLPPFIHIFQEKFYDLLQITDAAIAVSGTVTLEVALMQVPFCIIYKTNPLSFWIAKKCIRVKHIGLCNIISEKTIVQEFIQDNATAEKIAEETLQLLSDKSYGEKIKAVLAELRNQMMVENKNPSEKVAAIAMEMLCK